MSEHNLQRLETLSERTFPLLEDGTAIRSARRAVWRRVGEFCTVFALCCAVSLWYVYMRPAIYESTAMLQIIPRNSGFIGARPDTTDANDVNVQQHIAAHPSVTSRARQQVDEKLTTSDAATEPNPADLPALMSATILEGTDVLELRAEGSQAEQLSLLVDAWIDVYLASHQTAEKAAMPTANAALRKQLEELESRVKKNRESLADFRETHNIESMQREENHVLKQLKGLSEALNKAQDEQRVAAAQLKTIQEKLTRGKFVGEPEDQAVIDEMELAADQLQDIILQRRQLLTSAAFARDETAQKAKKQLTALNELIARKRALVVENAFDEAEIELATSRQISEATKKELAEYQQKAAEFTTRFAEHEALVAELNQLEKLYRALKEKLVHTEVIRDVLPPEVTVLQYASIPQDPIRPFYRRDAAIAVAGSLLCALI
ncbi:MAG: hypothetical protein GTO53_00985, partial [Planctomycetales bacterium]|nr:hypothetical protein [Planctomycetales bacterium]NIN07248.1 hypothetical protein [Planctomycetales bacterium]NIN76342.1 hypothetical protein [Planctomycetales bacterium]NIO33551.1 hypothetical protein [Planctomycetales bacterium]NIO45366.1 hypothetical protein [Planctomycetales bacterium]